MVPDSREVGALRTLMGWKSDQYRRTGRLDRFSQPWIIELLDSLLATRTGGLSGMLSVLYAGEAPAAAHFGLRSGPILAHWFPAYDTRFFRYSPGLIHHLRLAEESAAAGIQLIDLGKGAKQYKETLKSGDRSSPRESSPCRPCAAAAHWARWATAGLGDPPDQGPPAAIPCRRCAAAAWRTGPELAATHPQGAA